MKRAIKWLRFTSLLCVLWMACQLHPIPTQAASPTIAECEEQPEKCEEMNEPAEQTPQQQQAPLTEAKSAPTLWTYIKMVFAFAFVIGLLYVVVRLMGRKNQQFSSQKLMRNLGGVSVGPNKSVQLIAIGKQYFIVGVGEEVRLLKELVTDEELQQLQELLEQEQDSNFSIDTNPLINQWKKWTEQRAKKTQKPTSDSSFDSLFEQELNKVKRQRNNHLSDFVKGEHEKDE